MLSDPITTAEKSTLVFPPILSPAQAARMLDRTIGAAYHWPASGKFDGASRVRGKHRFYWRDRLVAGMHGETFRAAADGSIRLHESEIIASFAAPSAEEAFPPFASVDTVAKFLGVGRSTIFRWKALRHLDDTFVQRRDGIRFIRLPFMLSLFNGKDWQ
jgi:hypothetical protein